MEAKKLFFKECHLAGRQYYDVDEVWEELRIGTVLKLERQADNHYDKNAIQVIYVRESDNEPFLLGYVPRSDNETLSKLFDSGWNDLFDCRISKISPSVHYEARFILLCKSTRIRMLNQVDEPHCDVAH